MFKNGREFKIDLKLRCKYYSKKDKTNILRLFNKDEIFLGLGKYNAETYKVFPYKLLF